MASVVTVQSDLTAPTNVFRRVMAKHPELFLIVIGLTLTVISRYGSSLKQKPITIPPKPPKKFFPDSSAVHDYYNGDLEPVVRMLEKEEVVFLMYYAPWCSHSMSSRWEFHKAAKHMLGQVKFVAVNCWWPEGQCRKRYKFLMFPIIFLYHTHLDGFRYIGQMSASHMVRFIEDLVYPITSLHSHDHVKNFVTKHDSAVVGYFDFSSSPRPPGYQQFYFASMRTLEQDPYNQIKFGLINNEELAKSYNLTEQRDVVLLRVSNSSIKFPRDYNFTSSQIVTWSLENRQQPLVRVLAPLGVKSLILSREIEQGPAVIAFFALNPLFDTNQPFHVMKDLALHYHSCESNINLVGAISRWRSQILAAQIEYHQVVEFCANYRKQQNQDLFDFRCCVSIATKSLEESNEAQNVCEYCVHAQNQQQPACSAIDVDSYVFEWTDIRANHCRNFMNNYNANEYHSICCQSCDSSSVPVTPSDFLPMSFRTGKRRLTDRFVWQQIGKKEKSICRKLTLQKLQGHTSYNSFDIESLLPDNFTGLGCRNNRSMNFYAMDAVRHSVFAERLGVNISSLPQRPALVIFDKENEEQYLLKENFTSQNIATFILNFTRGRVRRTLRSIGTVKTSCDTNNTNVCIVEVTTESFHSVVMDKHKDVLLFVYSSWCGFCASLNHVYLSLAKYFQSAENIVFAKVNGDTNDLPWEFTVDSYPSIIFFPANKKSDSVVFPESISMILPNLIRFVLQHSTQQLRIETTLGVCSKTCIQKNGQYAHRTQQSVTKKIHHLEKHLTYLVTVREHLGEVGQMFNDISQKFVENRLQELQRSLKSVEKLLQFLEASNGVNIEHSKLHRFMKEQGLLQVHAGS